MLLRRQLRIVLHQIQSAENLGAVARLVANFDFPVLRLSDPQLEDTGAANRTAVHAAHVLASVERASRLEDAVAEAVYVLGTSGRDALRGRTPVSPEEGVERLRTAAARGPVVLVLGGERRGLSDQELALCQDVACIPAPGAQPSMNVAQAAAVLLYLASRADEAPLARGRRRTRGLPRRCARSCGGAWSARSGRPTASTRSHRFRSWTRCSGRSTGPGCRGGRPSSGPRPGSRLPGPPGAPGD